MQNYAWYSSAEFFNDSVKTGYFSDMMGSSGQSIYVRKKSQDYALGNAPLYKFNSENGFSINAQPAIFTRYSEVLLNFAEAACGCELLEEAWDALVRIRQRVGYEGDCGLDPAIKSDRAKMFEAILYERQIELAYEGKRFDDCHRWMLFDGGLGQELVSESSVLTGWGGNTCAYLGVTPLQSVVSHYIEMVVDPQLYTAEYRHDKDPFSDSLAIFVKPKSLTLTEDFRTVPPANEGDLETYNDSNVKALAEFYQNTLVRKDVLTMTTISEEGILQMPQWSPNYYFLGLHTADQTNNPNVVQNVGWSDYYGGMGLYDPLVDTPVVDRGKK